MNESRTKLISLAADPKTPDKKVEEILKMCEREDTNSPPERLVTVAETCDRLNISRTFLWALSRPDGERPPVLRPVKIGRRTLYREKDIDAVIRGDAEASRTLA